MYIKLLKFSFCLLKKIGSSFFFEKPPQEDEEEEIFIKLIQMSTQRGCPEEHPPSRH